MTETVVFEEKGFPVELVTARDIERAIAAGRLRPDTLVTTRKDDEAPVVRRARDVPQLKSHFDLPEEAPEAQAELASEPIALPEVEPEPYEDCQPVARAGPPGRMARPPLPTRSNAHTPQVPRRSAESRYLDPASFLGCAFAPLLRYADFTGRSSRREYVGFLIIQFLAYFIIASFLGSGSRDQVPVQTVIILGLFIPNFSAAARRLHDHGKSGWLLLLMIIPYIGPLILLVLLLLPGDEDDNRHGPDPARP